MLKRCLRQNGRYPLWALCLSLLWLISDCAYAIDCSIPPKYEYVFASYEGFLDATKKSSPLQLPANALGVLFYIPPYQSTEDIPASLDSRAFAIMDLDSGTSLGAKVQRVYDAMTSVQEEFRKSEKMNGNPVAGLYRVGPERGFEQGKNYEIRYLNRPESSIYVHIGPAVSPGSLGKSRLNLLDARRSLLEFRKTAACNGGSALAEVHDWEMIFPEEIAPYEPLLFASVSYKTPDMEFRKMEFAPPAGGTSGHHHILSNEKIKGSVFSTCNPDTGETTPVYLKITIRFLEITDQAFEIPSVEVPGILPKMNLCNEMDFLWESIDNGDWASYGVALHTMIERGFARDPSKLKAFLTSQLAASSHPNKKINAFVRIAVLSFSADYLNSLGTWKESHDMDLGQLGDAFDLKRVGPLDIKDLDTFESVISAVTQVLPDAESTSLDPEAVAIILNEARKLKIQQVNGSSPPGLQMDIFMPALTMMLAKGSNRDCKDAAKTLALLGKDAKSAVPALLDRNECAHEALIAAAEIAPGDGRVGRRMRLLSSRAPRQ